MNVGAAHRLLSDADIQWIAGNAPVRLPPHTELRRRLAEEEPFRLEVLGSEWLFQRMMDREDALPLISPRLFFEVLLRRAATDLDRQGHTWERSGRQQLPVFDSAQVAELASLPVMLDYLAGTLASFTRTQSYTVRVWVWHGIVSKVRYSDIDVHSLMRLAQRTGEAERFPLYRRAGDVCLLILGIFPEYAATAHRYPGTGQPRLRSRSRPQLGVEEYETLGQQLYGLAAECPEAAESGLVHPLSLLRDHIIEAKKPLNFIAEHYLGHRRGQLFG